MTDARLRLEPSWKERVGGYFDRPDMQALSEFLRNELRAGKVVFPPPRQIFAALDATPFDAVKVVRLNEGPGESAQVWCAMQYGYLPVRIVLVEKDGTRYEHLATRVSRQ